MPVLEEVRSSMQLWGLGVKALILIAIVLVSPLLGGTLLTTMVLAVGIAIGAIAASIARRPQHGLQFAFVSETDSSALDAHTMVSTASLDGTFKFANDNFCNVMGVTRDQLVGHSVFESLYFEDDLPIFLEITEHLRAGKSWTGEVRLRAMDGREVWTQTTAVPRRNWLGIIDSSIIVRTDITENKRAQSQHSLIATFDNLAEQVAMFAVSDGTLQYMNKSAKHLFGLKDEDLGNIKLSQTKLEYDVDLVQREVNELIRKRVAFVDFVLRLEGIPYDVRVQRIDVNQADPCLIAFFRDRSGKERLEQEKAQFISTVSHELRTPLTSIKGAVELALATVSNPQSSNPISEKCNKLLAIAQRNTDRLLLIVNDILDLEKIDADQMSFNLQDIDLKRLAHDAVVTNRPYFDELDVHVEVVWDCAPVDVQADPDRLNQVMVNLLSNAAKYSHAGDSILVKLWGDDSVAGFSVIDTGDGIPENALATIFDRFRQVPGARQIGSASSGLGLAIVKSIVERHAGRVWIESKIGEGTSVHCEFPRTTLQETAIEGPLST